MTEYEITFTVKDIDGSWDVLGMLNWAYNGWPKFKIQSIKEDGKLIE